MRVCFHFTPHQALAVSRQASMERRTSPHLLFRNLICSSPLPQPQPHNLNLLARRQCKLARHGADYVCAIYHLPFHRKLMLIISGDRRTRHPATLPCHPNPLRLRRRSHARRPRLNRQRKWLPVLCLSGAGCSSCRQVCAPLLDCTHILLTNFTQRFVIASTIFAKKS